MIHKSFNGILLAELFFLGKILFAISFTVLAPSSADELRWNSEPGFRWAELSVSVAGKTGFTLLPPERTGIFFTNRLDERAGEANRVLFNGSGVAVGDFDNDGLPDIFFCSLNGQHALYKNLGNWKFRDVTQEAGILCTNQFCRGAVFADVNGDGNLDLLIATTGQGVMCFLNGGNGTFRDATLQAGTKTKFGSVTLALADVDGNGTLDLYVANNRGDDIRDRGQIDVKMLNGKLVIPNEYQGRLAFAEGKLLEFGEPDILYLNDGKGHFTPVSWTGGDFLDEEGLKLEQPPLDWGLTASFRDINGDGYPDLYVCNDYWTPDRIWMNDGKGHFRAISKLAIRHTSASSMGVDFADANRSGRTDFFVVDMLSRDLRLRKRQMPAQHPKMADVGEVDNRPQVMRNTFFQNRGDGTFSEVANYAGLEASDWSWSPIFIDVDLDGYEDLLITAGHTKDVQDIDASRAIDARQKSYAGFANPKERQEEFIKDKIANARLYPRLDMPIVAYRNLGNLKFEEVTTQWGTESPGIHHGMALADFDQDGDLDLVVNNLGSPAGIYRNETIAPRVAVRLKGNSPNTQGIGAKIRFLNGAVPMQSQEIASGGHYMAGSDALLVFAAKTNTAMTIEVIWRNGFLSTVTNVTANRIYEIDEDGSRSRARASMPKEEPWFADLSQLLGHTHHEDLFDDFERQPLLPAKLSQQGPGLAWCDLNHDGHADLVIGSGKGGSMAIYLNNGNGAFELSPGIGPPLTRDQTSILSFTHPDGLESILAGSDTYEDGLSIGACVREFDFQSRQNREILPAYDSSIGPMALADLDGNGKMRLFIGGRVIPGHYPEAADSRIFRLEGEKWIPDQPNTERLRKIGLVSASLWSDLDGDGIPELILACDWDSPRVFKMDRGLLREITSDLGLAEFTGRWNGITTGDFDGDGRLDLAVSNWGLNGADRATPTQPLRLYYGKLGTQNTTDVIEADYDAVTKETVPRRRLGVLAASIPALTDRFSSHQAFSQVTVEKAFAPEKSRLKAVAARTLASMVFLNRGNHFEAVELPLEAQLSPAFGVNVADFDGDGAEDIFLSQNFFEMEPETSRLDAGRGLLLRGDGKGHFSPVPGQESGILIYGEQRGSAVADFDEDGRVDLAVSQNGAATKLFRNIRAKPGVRVRIIGPPGNLRGIGCAMRLKFADHMGPVREIHGGSGYWSQDAAVQVLAAPTLPNAIWIRWPGGHVTETELAPAQREITVDNQGRLSRSLRSN